MAAKSAKTKILLNITSFVLHILLNVVFYILVVLLVARLSTIAYNFSYQLYGNVAVEESPGRDITIQIKKGESTMAIAKKLEYNKLVLNQYSFYIRAKLTTTKQPILPGKYTLNTSMNYEKILKIITDPGGSLENKKESE